MLSRKANGIARLSQSARSGSVATEEQVTNLHNGLTVASLDVHGASSQLVLAFRAGTRYEAADEKGLVHHARVLAGTDTHKYKGTQLIWNLAQSGGALQTSSSRDVLTVSAAVPRDQTAMALSILGEAAAQTSYEPWIIEEQLPFLKIDNLQRCLREAVVEDLHRAAYRNHPLANSNYASKAQIGKLKYTQLQRFAAKYFVTGNAVLVGVNVDHEDLVHYATEVAPINEGAAVRPEAAVYRGGEFRRDTGGDRVVVALAGEGFSMQNVKGTATQTLVAELLGRIKVEGVQLEPLSVQYADTGLLGLVFTGQNSAVGKAVKQAAAKIRQLAEKTTFDDLANTKLFAKHKVLQSKDSTMQTAHHLVQHLLNNGKPLPHDVYANTIADISDTDVKSALTKIASNFSVAAIGDLTQVPYRDEL